MKNTIFKLSLLTLGIIVIFSCSKEDKSSAAFESAVSTTAPIPDSNADCGMVEVLLNVSKEGIISDGSKVTLELDLQHPFIGDLALELIAPDGNSCGIFKRILTQAANVINGTGKGSFVSGNKLNFISEYTKAITGGDGIVVASGNYKPTFGTNPLPNEVVMKSLNDFFKNKNIKGDWKIKVYDCAFPNAGTINGCKLKFAEGALQ